MADSDNKGINKSHNRAVSPRTTSFAGKHPELAGDIPDSFRKVPPNRREFDYARDRYIGMQLVDMEKTEAQRRGESERNGRSSEMVKRSKPFPELRPANEQAPIRQAFNRAWLREQREARLAELERQRQREQQNAVQEQAIEQSRKAMEREWEEHVPQR